MEKEGIIKEVTSKAIELLRTALEDVKEGVKRELHYEVASYGTELNGVSEESILNSVMANLSVTVNISL